MTRSASSPDLGRLLAAAEAASPVQAVEAMALELGRAFDAVAVSFLIVDMSGRALVRLTHSPTDGSLTPGTDGGGARRDGDETAAVVPLDHGPHEQALRTQTTQVVAPDPDGPAEVSRRWCVITPVTERGESIGLLELYLPTAPDEDTVATIGQVAHLLAFVVIANHRHTDLFEWGQRTRHFSLSAEIQQRLLPPARTCEASAFTLSGWLEPAATIGGDTFDYSLDRDVLHLSLTDAMGHGVNAALTASTCLAGFRGGRRRGLSLSDQVATTNNALYEHATADQKIDYVTGIVGRLALESGVLTIVNAGHVPPYLLRGSQVHQLDLPADLPLGMFTDSTYTTTDIDLMPGDRLVLVTDGMLERHVESVNLPQALLDTRELHPREVVRALADSALVAAGHALQDDATLLCLDWHGSHHLPRDADLGANLERASASSAQEDRPV